MKGWGNCPTVVVFPTRLIIDIVPPRGIFRALLADIRYLATDPAVKRESCCFALALSWNVPIREWAKTLV